MKRILLLCTISIISISLTQGQVSFSDDFESYEDIHSANIQNEITQIKTFYEQMFSEIGTKITYLSFRLNKTQKIIDPPFKNIDGYKY